MRASARDVFDPETFLCPAAGLQCAPDCATIVTCLKPDEPAIASAICPPPTPYCTNGGCSSAPNPVDPNCDALKAGAFLCTGLGTFPDPRDCTRFHECSAQGADSVPMSCPANTVYDSTANLCRKRGGGNCHRLTKCDRPKNSLQLVGFNGHPAYFAFCPPRPTDVTLMFKCEDELNYVFDERQHSCRYDCKRAGQFVDRRNCNGYILCRKLNGRWAPQPMWCPLNSQFVNGRCVRSSTACTNEL